MQSWLCLAAISAVIRFHFQVKSLLRTKIAVDIYFIIFNIIRTFNAFCCISWLGTVNAPFFHTLNYKKKHMQQRVEKKKKTKNNWNKKDSEHCASWRGHFYLVYVSISFMRRIGVISNNFRFHFSSNFHPKTRKTFTVFYGMDLGIHFVLIRLFVFRDTL